MAFKRSLRPLDYAAKIQTMQWCLFRISWAKKREPTNRRLPLDNCCFFQKMFKHFFLPLSFNFHSAAAVHLSVIFLNWSHWPFEQHVVVNAISNNEFSLLMLIVKCVKKIDLSISNTFNRTWSVKTPINIESLKSKINIVNIIYFNCLADKEIPRHFGYLRLDPRWQQKVFISREKRGL